MVLKKLLERFAWQPPNPLARAGIPPAVYHYTREAGGTFTRFHLRVDSTGQGLLLANASAAARLRPSGVIIAKGLLEGDDEGAIVDRLRGCFADIASERVAGDVERVRKIITTLDSPGDNYPILNLADPSFSPQSAPLDRPLSADLPLAEPQRLVPILDRLWELGIPHVTLIAGQNPDAEALLRAVERSEDLGMIAGVRGRGSDLLEGSLLKDLASVGVDHVDVLYLSAQPDVHDALAGDGDHAKALEALAEIHKNEVCPVAEVALTEATVEGIDETIESLASHGVASAAFFAIAITDGKATGGALPAGGLTPAARLVEEAAEESDVRCLWYPPVRCHLGSSLAELARRGPRCSGDTAVRIEPDGSVIPARGPAKPAGNLLRDDWPKIRRHPIYRDYRHRVETDTHCDECPGLAICAADCPRDPAGWA